MVNPSLMEVPKHRQLVCLYFESLFEQSNRDVEELFHSILNKKTQLWFVALAEQIRAMYLTEIIIHKDVKSLYVTYLVGNLMGKWFQACEKSLIEFAEAENLSWIDFETERNAKRFLGFIGYKPVSVRYRKTLKGN